MLKRYHVTYRYVLWAWGVLIITFLGSMLMSTHTLFPYLLGIVALALGSWCVVRALRSSRRAECSDAVWNLLVPTVIVYGAGWLIVLLKIIGII